MMTLSRQATTAAFISIFGLALLTIPCQESVAQEETTDVEVIENQEPGGAPIVISATQTSDGNGGTAMRIMSADLTGGGDGSFFMANGGDMSFSLGMGEPDQFNLLQNPSVQKDLELVSDQMDKIKKIQSEFNEKMQSSLKDLQLGNMSGAQKLGETISELRELQSKQINDLLLEHQQTRLQQIALQQHMKSAGTAGALSSKRWAEALGIDEDQVKRLTEKAKMLKEERAKKIAKIDADIKDSLLKELTPEQRKKLKDLTGDKYETKTSDWRERFERRARRGIPSPRKDDN